MGGNGRPVETLDMLFAKIVIVVALAAILWNLGAGLYYMMTDRSGSDRVVKALTRRIAISVGLIVVVAILILTDVIQPHGI